MKSLILGGAGFLGSHICDYLQKENHEIIAVDDLSRGKEENIKCQLEIMDLTRNQHRLFTLLNEWKSDYVFHFAAINGTNNFYERSKDVLWHNVDITMNLLHMIENIEHKPKIIYASSSEIYGNPEKVPTDEDCIKTMEVLESRDTYAISKYIGEFFVMHSGLNYLILRIFNVYGKRDRLGHVIPDILEKIKNKDNSVKGTGKETRSFIYIDDFINLLSKLLEVNRWNDIFNIGNPEEVKIKKLVDLLYEKNGFEEKPNFTGSVKGDRNRRCPDIRKLLDVIGDYRFIDLEEGIKKV